jgi:hypothetical protein
MRGADVARCLDHFGSQRVGLGRGVVLLALALLIFQLSIAAIAVKDPAPDADNPMTIRPRLRSDMLTILKLFLDTAGSSCEAFGMSSASLIAVTDPPPLIAVTSQVIA